MKAKEIIHLFLLTGFVLVSAKCVFGQNKSEQSKWNKDHIFPAARQFTLHASTGIPYLGAAEFAFGFSKRFSAGVFFGLPASGANAYGIRARKIKQKKVWKNFAIGFGVDAVLFGILAIGYSNSFSGTHFY